MQKRDKKGRFVKKKSSKKKSKPVKFVHVQKVKKTKVTDLYLEDLQDMIAAEISLQIKEMW